MLSYIILKTTNSIIAQDKPINMKWIQIIIIVSMRKGIRAKYIYFVCENHQSLSERNLRLSGTPQWR